MQNHYFQYKKYAQACICVFALFFSGAIASAQAKLLDTTSIDGPGTGTVNEVYDVALANDGKSGGIVYLKQADGQNHVFFVPVSEGRPGTPKRIDNGQANGSTFPSITAANNGKIGIYWINSQKAHYVVSNDGGTTLSSIEQIGTKANVNTLYADTNANGVVYASLCSSDDIHAYRIENGAVTAVNSEAALDHDQTKQAGSLATSEESRTAVAPNGNAYLVWSENGTQEAYVRYLTGVNAGVEKRLDSDFPFRGHPEGTNPTSRQTRVRVNGAGIATVIFNNFVDYSGTDMPRAIARTVAPDGTLGPLVAADGLGDTPNNTDQGVEFPGAVINQIGFDQNANGNALFGAYRQNGKYIVATALQNGLFSEPFAKLTNTEILTTGPAVAIGDEVDKGFYAWSADPGTGLRTYFTEATLTNLSSEVKQLSKDEIGPSGNVFADADRFGNGIIAFKQSNDRVVFSAFDQPPTTPEFVTADGSQLDAGVGKIEWKAVSEDWGPVNYSVKIDGQQVTVGAQTAATIPANTAVGTHTITVEALDRENQTSQPASRQFIVKGSSPQPKTSADLKKISFRNGVASITVANQSAATAQFIVTLRSKSKLRLKVKKRTVRRIVTFGNRRISVGPGRTVTVKIRLSRTSQALLRKLRKISAVAKVDVVGQPASQSVQKAITLRAPKRK